MTLSYNVKYINQIPANTTAIAFNPKTIDIAIGERLTGAGGLDTSQKPIDLLRVAITLREPLLNATGNEIGYNMQYKELIIPAAYMDSVIVGYDTILNKVKIDPTALAGVLSNFGLQLV